MLIPASKMYYNKNSDRDHEEQVDVAHHLAFFGSLHGREEQSAQQQNYRHPRNI